MRTPLSAALWCAALLLATPAFAQNAASTSASAPTAAEGTAAEKSGAPNTLTPAEAAAGWILLFDGETLFGWEGADAADWAVKDGAITVSQGKKSLLTTTTEFSDYALHVEFKAPAATNSGVFLRTPAAPKDPAADCYELNIAPNSNAYPTGGFVKRQKAAAVTEWEQWRSFDVTAVGGKFVVQLDGKTVLEYTDASPIARGRIGLQLNEGAAAFRSIKLKPLGAKSIFNGKDLSGWKVAPGLPSVYSVTPEGWLNVKNGKGQIESEGVYKDFVFQMEVFSNGKHLNSGLFFRSIPGEVWNGYESQIQNGYKDGDRTQPLDFGTGAIYRRVKARKVVSDDGVWFSKTIVAVGPHISVWVNGYQVTDWTDPRPPHANPRNGLRLEGGTFILQGHDPTTDLSFRNLRVLEQ